MPTYQYEAMNSVGQAVSGQVEAASEDYLAREPMAPAAMFDHLYGRLPLALEAQRDAMAEAPATAEDRSDA